MAMVQRRRLATLLRAGAGVLAMLASLHVVCRGQAYAQSGADGKAPVLLDNMDGGAPVLKLLNQSGVRVLAQAVEHGSSGQGVSAERLVMNVPAGASAMVAYDIPPAPVIEELRLSAWVACNRPGALLAATVVLPRSKDAQTGQPRELLLRADKTADGGWQQLTLIGLPALLADQARVARATRTGEIDERGAYVRQIVILAPGGPGNTELLVDQLAVHGVLSAARAAGDAAAEEAGVVQAAAQATRAPVKPMPARPRLPRIIQWQGEPLPILQRMGFDAVWMGRLPTEAELEELRGLGMFCVCPPPSPEQIQEAGLTERFEPVLAWDLGQLVQAADLELVHRWAQLIELHECDPARPTLLEPLGMAREASRVAEVLMIGRPTLGSSQTWAEYAGWLNLQRRMARLGSRTWVGVETHCSTRFMAQLAALGGGQANAIVPASLQDLSRATTAAFGITPRGFCFQSHASLVGNDIENRQRALALELTNLRLGLAEPWLAPGKPAVAAQSTQPNLTGLVLKVERSHLIIPMQWGAEAEPPRGAKVEPLAFTLPGVPETSDAYLVSISGTQRLQGKRVTGGLRISIEHLPDDAFVLVTEDGYAFAHVERYLRQHAPRAAQMRVELAALERQQAQQALSQLPASTIEASGIREELRLADAQMTAVIETMRRRDYAAAFACAAEAERLLDAAKRRVAQTVAANLPAGSSPVPLSWRTMVPAHRASVAAGQSSAPAQLFPGGEFETLEALLTSGWERVQSSPDGAEATVRLSPEAPARGVHCLELDARSLAPDGKPPMLPRPPVWVTSPPLQVPAGHLVEITGLARLGEAPIGSPDPLLVFDSVGGEESAVRISSAPSWTPFRLVRAAAAGTELRVTIALGGVGRAQIDSLGFRFIPIAGSEAGQSANQAHVPSGGASTGR
jgi:hypothetical protein